MLNKRYITEDEMTHCVASLMPTVEMNYLRPFEITERALEWFADELGVSANISACKVVAKRCLTSWESTKMRTLKI